MFFNDKRVLQQTYDSLNRLTRAELQQITDDLACYAVWSIETPNKRIPPDKRKYGCVTYLQAGQLYDTVVERYNSLLEKEQKQ